MRLRPSFCPPLPLAQTRARQLPAPSLRGVLRILGVEGVGASGVALLLSFRLGVTSGGGVLILRGVREGLLVTLRGFAALDSSVLRGQPTCTIAPYCNVALGPFLKRDY